MSNNTETKLVVSDRFHPGTAAFIKQSIVPRLLKDQGVQYYRVAPLHEDGCEAYSISGDIDCDVPYDSSGSFVGAVMLEQRFAALCRYLKSEAGVANPKCNMNIGARDGDPGHNHAIFITWRADSTAEVAPFLSPEWAVIEANAWRIMAGLEPIDPASVENFEFSVTWRTPSPNEDPSDRSYYDRLGISQIGVDDEDLEERDEVVLLDGCEIEATSFGDAEQKIYAQYGDSIRIIDISRVNY